MIYLLVRVTRLGDFSTIWRLLTLASFFMTVAQNLWAYFFQGKCYVPMYVLILT
jgi:hypothetical protein